MEINDVACTVVTIYTDGACKGNPGPGGWGVVLEYGEHLKELCGGELQTTNNRMEMTAVIKALSALKRPCVVRLFTDSQYLLKGTQEWLPKWQRNQWRTASKKPVKNEDLWRVIHELLAQHQVEWHWIKGHSGHPGNERADTLANEGVSRVLQSNLDDQN